MFITPFIFSIISTGLNKGTMEKFLHYLQQSGKPHQNPKSYLLCQKYLHLRKLELKLEASTSDIIKIIMDIAQHSQKTKQEADDLLKYGNVMEVLSEFGKVVITGSYKYDLMYGPDIDLVVLSDDPEKSSYEAFLDFIHQRKFQKYQLGDFSRYPREGRPKAIIIVLIHEYKGKRWEIEIWFNKSLSDDDARLDELISKATEEQKRIILELKHQREADKISKHKLDSTTIYKGVLSEGKTSLKDFNLD